MATTIGQLLLNDVLPASHQITGTTSKKQLNTLMLDLAKKDPHTYVQTIGKLKRVGDAITTDEGITVGLDDIEPDYKQRDRILEPALARVKRLRDEKARVDLIQKTQQQMLEITKKHPGQMTPMTLSGARGKPAQLMRSVTTPAAVVDAQEHTIPWLISKSYAEGLKPADSWIAMGEARRNAIEAYTSVAAPGEMSKILVNNMSDQLITMPDCETKNGIMMDANDSNIVDRFRADTGDLVTARNKPKSGSIRVRSPMTCEAPNGVCQKCYGLDTKGAIPRLGHNVGMIAAHAMGEPLTQMTLSAKHATRTAEKQKNVLRGLSGFKQITEIPQSFFNKATLSSQQGTVTAIKKAPQGGHYVHVDEQQHYVPPNLDVIVRKGHRVNTGDALSDGIPRPDEVVKYKGLGEGRKYLADSLHDIYRRTGIDIDKRHLEILAKTDLNYIRVLDRDDASLGVMKGDIVDYNRFRAQLAKNAKEVPTREALGQRLGNSLLHHTAGVLITPAMVKDFRRSGIQKIPVTPNAPLFEPVMKPISRAPLLHPDFLARLGHRNLKNVILEGAAFGEMADIHGTHPVPAFVFGEEFGQGPQGRY